MHIKLISSYIHASISGCDDHSPQIGSNRYFVVIAMSLSWLISPSSSEGLHHRWWWWSHSCDLTNGGGVLLMWNFLTYPVGLKIYWSRSMSIMFARAQSFKWCFKMLSNKIIVVAVWYGFYMILPYNFVPLHLQICQDNLKIGTIFLFRVASASFQDFLELFGWILGLWIEIIAVKC